MRKTIFGKGIIEFILYFSVRGYLMKRKVAINYIFTVLNQVVAMIIPLITTPYISAVLGAEGIGTISYISAISTYVIIICTYGTSTYACKVIAYNQGKKDIQSRMFWELFLLRGITLTVGLFLYVIYALTISNYKLLMLINSILLLAEMINIGWLFDGNEDFIFISLRAMAVKIVGVCLVFVFVHEVDDLWKYALILAISTFGGNIAFWIGLKKYICFAKIQIEALKIHLMGSIKLFIPQLANSVYLYLDKVMLGILTETKSENGYYEQTQKLIRLSLTVITALSTVMLPRVSNAVKENGEEKVKEFMNSSLKIVFLLGMPMIAGLCAISDNLVPWFMGQEFMPVINLLCICSPIFIFNGIYSIIGTQYFIPLEKEKQYTFTVMLGAFINMGLNILLIPRYQSIGASIGSMIAEAVVAIVGVFFARRFVSISTIASSIWKYLVGSIIMFFTIRIVAVRVVPGMIQTLILIIIGVITYVSVECLLKEFLVLGFFTKRKN